VPCPLSHVALLVIGSQHLSSVVSFRACVCIVHTLGEGIEAGQLEAAALSHPAALLLCEALARQLKQITTEDSWLEVQVTSSTFLDGAARQSRTSTRSSGNRREHALAHLPA
jgi:hypothetical protein